MTWTTKPPTEAGLYLVRWAGYETLDVVRLQKWTQGEVQTGVFITGSTDGDEGVKLADVCLWWPVPITPPPLDGKEDEGEVEGLAVLMHETYEHEASVEGWETQTRCRVEWNALPPENRATMRTVARVVLAAVRGGR